MMEKREFKKSDFPNIGGDFLSWLYVLSSGQITTEGVIEERNGFKKDSAIALGKRLSIKSMISDGFKVSMSGVNDSVIGKINSIVHECVIKSISIDITIENKVYTVTMNDQAEIANLVMPSLFDPVDVQPTGEQTVQDVLDGGKDLLKRKRKVVLPIDDMVILRDALMCEVDDFISKLFTCYLKIRSDRDMWPLVHAEIRQALARFQSERLDLADKFKELAEENGLEVFVQANVKQA